MSSHSSFYQGTKRISPLKIRNPSILPSQIMPSPTGAPFNFAEMPWSYGVKPGQVMEFNAVIRPSPIAVPVGPSSPVLSIPSCSSLSPPTFGPPSPTAIIHNSTPHLPEVRKRKTDLDMALPNLLPTKQFLTEEMMSSHLNNLHLSSEYTAHDINRSSDSSALPGTSATLDDGDMMLSEDKSQQPYIVCMSPQELEERLKKAQRIAICEEVRKLDTRAEILPKVILERMEKPCTALMIWQPPQERLDKLFSTVTEQLEQREQQANKKEREASSSTSSTISPTTGITSSAGSVAQWSMDDETLPDLPDYDEDLDDFEPQQGIICVGSITSQPAVAPDPATMDIEM
ncbi:hypothetical protein AND_010038 [Anopheles darlingi]|uniref:Uncharacterized protein n=1 Tax=Anopheles darlingi TaxID=43151 RepID=W5J6A5_ANODA|nr:hypothetical protein AND_010038 [Anopheles darlingi]